MTRKCKKKSDIDDADEVQEITAARTPMEKKKHVCVWHVTKQWHCKTSVKTYKGRSHWAQLTFCGKTFGNKKEVDNHISEACEPISSENCNEHIFFQKRE